MELNFEKNLGDADRVIRIIIGSVLLWLVTLQHISGGWAVFAVVLGVSQYIEAALAY